MRRIETQLNRTWEWLAVVMDTLETQLSSKQGGQKKARPASSMHESFHNSLVGLLRAQDDEEDGSAPPDIRCHKTVAYAVDALIHFASHPLRPTAVAGEGAADSGAVR